MFKELNEINKKPKPFEFYTVEDLWADEHTSKKMLEYHLNESIDVSSRNINFINQSVSWIVSSFNLNSNSNLLDFGCGPGLYTNRFAEKEISVIGVDFSNRSIEYAKQIASNSDLNVDYIQKNYLDFETDKKFDLITMIMCDFCALSPNQRKIMLGKFSNLLKPNGKVLLDAYSLNYFNQKDELSTYELNYLDNFWSPEDYYCFNNYFKYNDVKVTLDKYTIIEKNRKRVVFNWLQYFSVGSLKKEFEENNLIIDDIYSDVTGKDYNSESLEFAVVARRKQ
ncbi:MAG TPA: class I SAM-dependent methyltransferase [Candidatus Nanoarchaeia archaeon]|nr:class I SAM-dependent methyltransferase [Candidatus Nanoarchaeia archaeon]